MDPLATFDAWLAEARASEPHDAEAMALASVGADGAPSVRMVLLKAREGDGFTFFTNMESRKSGELASESRAALLFHWKSLRRQVRIEGWACAAGDEASDRYFATRSRDSQLGAWASDQSRPLPDRETLERRFEEARARYADGPVPRPSHWSGWTLKADRIELWSDKPHRLHERRLFVSGKDGWTESLLYP